MTSLAGTGALTRVALRRSRILIAVWLAVFGLMANVSAAATRDLYPTLSSLVQAAETINSSTALVALYGRIYDPSSLGAVSLIKLGGFGAVFVAMLAVVLVVRHTRADEEAGRTELLGATAIGRLAPLASALVLVALTNAALALVTFAALAGAGLPVDGSLAFGVAWAGVGLSFGAIAGVAAQVTTSGRAATSLSSIVLAAVYVLRAVGDAADEGAVGALTWLSPIGWGQQFRPYAGNRWWVLLITLGFTGAVGGIAVAIARRRDVGTGLLPTRPGPPVAAGWLSSPFALAWRLQRAAFVGWAASFLLMGALLGSLVSSVSSFLNNPQARELFMKLGGEKVFEDAFIAAELAFGGIAAGAFGIQAVLRLRAEELGERAAPVLSTAVHRLRWAMSHVAIALGGSVVMLLLLGVGAGAVYALQVHDAGQIPRVMGAALAHVPEAWTLIGITLAAYGVSPRLAMAGWAALGAFVVLGELGPLLNLPQWVMDLSPFTHTPKLPGVPVAVTALAVLLAVALALGGAGLAALRRRDLG